VSKDETLTKAWKRYAAAWAYTRTRPCYETQWTCQSAELVAGAQRPAQHIQNLIFSLRGEDYSSL
jgi:hypothetical protein